MSSARECTSIGDSGVWGCTSMGGPMPSFVGPPKVQRAILSDAPCSKDYEGLGNCKGGCGTLSAVAYWGLW